MAQHELSIREGELEYWNCQFDDFYVNKKRLSDVLKQRDATTPFGWWPESSAMTREDFEDGFARMLLGLAPSDLREGRIPVYICGACADYGCGATTCRVTLSHDLVEWSDFGWDATDRDEEETQFWDELLGHHFYFDRGAYEGLIGRYLKGGAANRVD